MKLIDSIARRFGYTKRPASGGWRRNLAFKAAENSRLTEDWPTRILSADSAVGTGLRTMRSRSRDLERNDSHARGFGKALVRNVLGSEGIAFQSKVVEANGVPDKLANLRIEEAWYRWGINRFCDVERKLTWREMQTMALRRAAYDGEVLLRWVRETANPYGISLRLIEADLLDETHSENLENGGTIRMGVERNAIGQVTAYHLLNGHPGDTTPAPKNGNRRERVPAELIIHLFLPERPGQSRGWPWLTAAIRDLGMLGGYKEAELVAARVSAAKAGFITKTFPDGMPYPEEEDGSGKTMEVEPGIIEELPMGSQFTPWDPTHPNTAFGDFVKSALRSVATGMGVSYNTLSSDLEGVNYSSIRAGLLDEREEWLQIQSWLIDHLCRPVFRKWLEVCLLGGAIKLPPEKLEKFTADTWRGRRWQWVDPEKDVRAGLLAVEGGLKSRRQIVAESGGDIEETLDEIAQDNQMADEKGVTLSGPNGAQPVAKPAPEPNPPSQ